MFKRLKNNKLALGMTTGALALALVAGSTYAWFTATDNADQQIQMGTLRVSANLVGDRSFAYEPGTTYEANGTVKNTGSTISLVSIADDTLIEFRYADNNLTPVTEKVWTPDSENAVSTTLSSPDYTIQIDDEGNVTSAWMVDTNNPADKYLLLAPGAEVELNLTANLKGEVMGNKYQGSKIKLQNAVKATQTFDGALKETFNIANNDLDLYLGEFRTFAARRGPSVSPEIMAQIDAMLHR